MLNDNRPLIIFEMANNHMGSIEHGLHTIDAFANFVDNYPFRFAFKFQFRDLESFIHPDFQERMDLKYVKRFSETGLTSEEFAQLVNHVKTCGMVAIATPFDEPSLKHLDDLGVEIIKIASCSLTDWPLLETIVTSVKPIIASTAGSSLDEIDKVVSFFQHRKNEFAILHCVGEYPTVPENLQMNQLSLLQKRYPEVPIGFSTHEEPTNFDSVFVAFGKGALIFEKHIAVETEEFPRNAYSATPEEMKRWLDNALKAYQMLGTDSGRHPISAKEQADLRQFKRGVFAKHDLKAGSKLKQSDLFFAFPNENDQLLANDISKYTTFTLTKSIPAKTAIFQSDVTCKDYQKKVYEIVQDTKALFKKAGVIYPGGAELELSHHYGIDNFYKTGSTMITVVNRDYCKKLIALLPGQSHPEQYHKEKEETFHVLFGSVELYLDGVATKLKPGATTIVEPGVKHRFASTDGCVLEEISSTHFKDDSFYTDDKISQNQERKTIIRYWLD